MSKPNPQTPRNRLAPSRHSDAAAFDAPSDPAADPDELALFDAPSDAPADAPATFDATEATRAEGRPLA